VKVKFEYFAPAGSSAGTVKLISMKNSLNAFSKFSSKDLNICTDFSVYMKKEKMVTLTLSMPKEYDELKKKYPEVNWNRIVKEGVLRKLEELKKFEELKRKGVI